MDAEAVLAYLDVLRQERVWEGLETYGQVGGRSK
jgi:hypothetical protein